MSDLSIGKRLRGPENLDNKAKKTKTETQTESSIFEAARRRHQARTGDAPGVKQEDTAPESSSHAAWEEQWKTAFPESMIDAVGAVRKQNTDTDLKPAAPGGPVYVVVHSVHGRYVDAKFDILRTYATAAAANEHAMVFFAEEYPHIADTNVQSLRRAGAGSDHRTHEGPNDSCWDVGTGGCLMFECCDEDGEYNVYVSQQAIEVEPPAKVLNSSKQAPRGIRTRAIDRF